MQNIVHTGKWNVQDIRHHETPPKLKQQLFPLNSIQVGSAQHASWKRVKLGNNRWSLESMRIDESCRRLNRKPKGKEN